MLTSHRRAHGAPPKSHGSTARRFIDDFRHAVELEYRLMPYVYTRAKDASERGLPMMRTLFIEYPKDPRLAGGRRVPVRRRHPRGPVAGSEKLLEHIPQLQHRWIRGGHPWPAHAPPRR